MAMDLLITLLQAYVSGLGSGCNLAELPIEHSQDGLFVQVTHHLSQDPATYQTNNCV